MTQNQILMLQGAPIKHNNHTEPSRAGVPSPQKN